MNGSWSWTSEEHRRLLALVEPTVGQLRTFRTPSTGEPVDPSHVSAIAAFVAEQGSLKLVDAYASLAPRSHMATYTRSAGPQLEKACAEAARVVANVRGILRSATDREQANAVVFVLGHVARMVRTQERQADGAPLGRDSGGPRRGRDGRR